MTKSVREATPAKSARDTARTFEELVHEENAWLADRLKSVPTPPEDRARSKDATECQSDISEPRVCWTPHDRFGLALSGGGIRSATFNLGLLQALSRPVEAAPRNKPPEASSILDLVDYVSTVSGGGYVGGFWSCWLNDHLPTAADASEERLSRFEQARASLTAKPERNKGSRLQHLFPQPECSGSRAVNPDAIPVRHLREHSRFLVPRMGLHEQEMWSAVVSVLGAMLPSLVIATALLMVTWYGWLFLQIAAAAGSAIGPAFLFSFSLGIFGLIEITSRRAKANGTEVAYWLTAVPCSLAIAAAWYVSAGASATDWWPARVASEGFSIAGVFASKAPVRQLAFGQLALPALPFVGAAAVLLLVVRPLFSRLVSASYVSVIDRLAGRCLVPALLWSVLAGLWCIAPRIVSEAAATTTTAGATAGAAGLFVWLRKWLDDPVRETHGGKLFDRFIARLKPVLPQALAYVVTLGMFMLVALVVHALGAEHFGLGISLALSVLLVALLAIDPQRIGLHEFYRSRIAATFLPAWYGPHAAEDVSLQDLADGSRYRRPIHLVCTTGNNLSGDALPTLNRGGCSVAVSPLGIAVGNQVAPVRELMLSSALTASAAAFNSQMGSVSKRIGPTVAFIMSALGLRLGIWVRQPSAHRFMEFFPGTYLLKEMLGMSASSGKHLHLSDGGHFENLALYELLRRRCRYVIVSDCGADAELAFDDLANATRRVREDFGIEIDLDVEPLRPNEKGFSQQHAVVGTIHYDGAAGTDKGILIYFKPTLLGDEPTDVMQYRTRNPAFPHESTTDQFYDEAQWESYRRLGEHCAGVVFRFVQQEKVLARANAVERLFLGAVERWQHLRNVDPERLDELMARRDSLLGEIRANAPDAFKAELFADIAEAVGMRAPDFDEHTMLNTLQYCIELTSLMDQVFEAAQLETHWAHQSNQVWMTFFHRVAATPSFRRFWLLLRPLCTNGLRDFIRVRFGLRITDPIARKREQNDEAVATLEIHDCGDSTQLTKGFALRQWIATQGRHVAPRALEYRVTWASDQKTLVLGFLLYRQQDNIIRWSNTELFVPPTLEGSGVSSRFLDAVISYFPTLKTETALTLMVTIDDKPPGDVPRSPLLDPAHRQARLAALHFYKSRGFTQQPSADHSLVLPLPANPAQAVSSHPPPADPATVSSNPPRSRTIDGEMDPEEAPR